MNPTRIVLISLALLSCWAGYVSPGSTAAPREEPETTVQERTPTADTTAASHIQNSLEHFVAGDYELSRRAANEALKLDPESAVAYNNICCAHIELGAHDQAILACNKALEIAPGFQRAWANLEWAYEEALKQTPTVSAYVNLSVARYWLGKLDKSMEASGKVLQLDPNNALAYNNICSVHAKREEWDRAIEACENSLAINPEYQRAKNNLKWAQSGKQGG